MHKHEEKSLFLHDIWHSATMHANTVTEALLTGANSAGCRTNNKKIAQGSDRVGGHEQTHSNQLDQAKAKAVTNTHRQI